MTLPIRMQRRRTKGWSAPPHTLYIGRTSPRPSRFANPYPVATYGRARALALFRQDLAALPAWELAGRLDALEAYDYLMCWCRREDACHGDIWLELLAARQKPQPPGGGPACRHRMGGAPMITQQDQLRWVQRELARRQRWITEGVRSGWSTERCAAVAKDLLILEALEQTLLRQDAPRPRQGGC